MEYLKSENVVGLAGTILALVIMGAILALCTWLVFQSAWWLLPIFLGLMALGEAG
jgi:fatty acid desaturase